MDVLQQRLQGTSLGDTSSNVKAIIEDEQLFGVNLYEIGLGTKIEGMFHEMLGGAGAVREALLKYVG
jgi:fructuronate reductase